MKTLTRAEILTMSGGALLIAACGGNLSPRGGSLSSSGQNTSPQSLLMEQMRSGPHVGRINMRDGYDLVTTSTKVFPSRRPDGSIPPLHKKREANGFIIGGPCTEDGICDPGGGGGGGATIVDVTSFQGLDTYAFSNNYIEMYENGTLTRQIFLNGLDADGCLNSTDVAANLTVNSCMPNPGSIPHDTDYTFGVGTLHFDSGTSTTTVTVGSSQSTFAPGVVSGELAATFNHPPLPPSIAMTLPPHFFDVPSAGRACAALAAGDMFLTRFNMELAIEAGCMQFGDLWCFIVKTYAAWWEMQYEAVMQQIIDQGTCF